LFQAPCCVVKSKALLSPGEAGRCFFLSGVEWIVVQRECFAPVLFVISLEQPFAPLLRKGAKACFGPGRAPWGPSGAETTMIFDIEGRHHNPLAVPVLGGLSIGGLGPQSKHAFDQRSKARRASLLCPLAHCARGRNGFSRELGQSLPRALGGVPLGDHNLFQGPQLMFQDATLLLGPGIRGPRLLWGGPAPPDSGP
jgi:hypothetical protein